VERTDDSCFAIASRDGQEALMTSFAEENTTDCLHGDGRARQRLAKLTEEDEILCASKKDERLLEDNDRSTMDTNSEAETRSTEIQQHTSTNGRSDVSLTGLDNVDMTYESNIEHVVRDSRLDDGKVVVPVEDDATVDIRLVTSERIATHNNGEHDIMGNTMTTETLLKYCEQSDEAFTDNADVLSELRNTHVESITERPIPDSDVTRRVRIFNIMI